MKTTNKPSGGSKKQSGSNGSQKEMRGGGNQKQVSSHGSKKLQQDREEEEVDTNEDASKLQELFEDQLKDIYWAEKALTKAMPKMIKNASSDELVEALKSHLAETQEQITRLEQVFEVIGKKAQAKKCEAMDGLIKEAEELMKGHDEGVVRDAAIIAAAQKVEHYEIATYGTLRAFAQTLGLDEAVTLLEETLDEEKGADEKLTEVAETAVNIEAAHEKE